MADLVLIVEKTEVVKTLMDLGLLKQPGFENTIHLGIPAVSLMDADPYVRCIMHSTLFS